jgi:hypothetical protein
MNPMAARHRIVLYRVLSRAAVTAAAVGLTLVAVRAGWGLLADKQLREVQQSLTGDAYRLDLARFAAPPVDDARNAAIPLLACLQAFDPQFYRITRGFASPGRWDAEWTALDRDSFRTLIADNAPALALLDAALARPAVAWPVSFDTLTTGDMPVSEKLNTLAEVLLSDAVLRHLDGRDDEAIARVQKVVALDAMVIASPTLAAHNVAVRSRMRFAAIVERLAPELAVAGGPATAPAAPPPGRTPAPAAAVLQLARALADTTRFHQQLVDACEFQIYQVDHPGDVADPALTPLRATKGELASWWLRPLGVDERRRALVTDAAWLPVLRADSYEPFRLLPAPYRPAQSALSGIVFASSRTVDSGWAGAVRQHFRALADSRAAAVLLAARLAEVDDGSPPAAADRLVPAYLPHAPADPFAADHRPFRYRLDPAGPTVWSVGENGVDDGGVILPFPRSRVIDQADLVFGAAWQAARAGAVVAPAATGPAASAPALP